MWDVFYFNGFLESQASAAPARTSILAGAFNKKCSCSTYPKVSHAFVNQTDFWQDGTWFGQMLCNKIVNYANAFGVQQLYLKAAVFHLLELIEEAWQQKDSLSDMYI